MMRMFSIIAVVLMCAGCAGEDAGPIVLVQDGKPMSFIVTADNPTEVARQGAEDLQMWLSKSSGATVPIKPESKVPEKQKSLLFLSAIPGALKLSGSIRKRLISRNSL